MRKNFWFAMLGLIAAVGFVIVALPRTAELADPSDNHVSTTDVARPSPSSTAPTTSTTTTTTTRDLGSFTPEELEAFNAFVAPTTTTTAPPPTTTTIYVPPPTITYVEPEPVYEAPEPAWEEPVVYGSGNSSDDAFVQCIIARESGGNPTIVNPSSGAAGLAQYMPSTWSGLGYADRYGVWSAHLATYDQQMEAIYDTLARVGRSPWAGPGC